MKEEMHCFVIFTMDDFVSQTIASRGILFVPNENNNNNNTPLIKQVLKPSPFKVPNNNNSNNKIL